MMDRQNLSAPEVEEAVERDYQWPPITSRSDWNRERRDDEGRIWIDGHRVTVEQHRRFREEWVAFYDGSACPEGNCDGERGHSGPHYAWTAE